MRFLVAPDKLKGSLSATQAAECIAAGILTAVPVAEIDLCPIADGGEGTVSAILSACGGRLITRRVTGPLPEMKVDAAFAILADNTTAVIEMAAASGLALLREEDRNPLATTTFGTGELIAAAIAEGAKKILLGLGGSATIDAGIGLAQACGCSVLTLDGQPTSMTEPLCGRDLANVLMIKRGRGEITAGIEIIALTDVTNPLFGPSGAPEIFGPQKGATRQMIDQLDSDLRNLATRTGNEENANRPGAGSAGGLGFGVLAFLGGSLGGGFDFLSDIIHLRDRLKNIDLCFTAEGRLDAQTICGKAVSGIARLCREQGVPCIALAGSIGDEIESFTADGLTASFAIGNGPLSYEESVRNAGPLLTRAARNCAALFAAKRDG